MTPSRDRTGRPGHFEQAIREYHEGNRGHPQFEVWLDYALETNQRGEHVVSTVRAVMPTLSGRRWLDVGCAYGGTCLAAARAGASATGVEVDLKLLELAAFNRQDHPKLEVELLHRDAMDWSQLSDLGRFDIISCDNVIEHVDIPEQLVAHLSAMLGEGGVVYVTIPNAFSLGQVKEDCHYGLPGITLLDPWDAGLYVRKALGKDSYEVTDYYELAVYESLFHTYGLTTRLLQVSEPRFGDPRELLGELDAATASVEQRIESDELPEALHQKLLDRMRRYRGRLSSRVDQVVRAEERDRQRLRHALQRDYCEELWFMLGRRVSPTDAPLFGRTWQPESRPWRRFLGRLARRAAGALRPRQPHRPFTACER